MDTASAVSRGAERLADKPNDPRLHAINNRICNAAEGIRAHTQGFRSKADAIVGSGPGEGAEKATPAPVPNGALQQIDMALDALERAVKDLGAVERRFVGLA